MVTRPSSEHPLVLLESSSAGGFPRSYRFAGLEAVIRAETPEEVIPALAEVEAAVARGRHAAGYVAYEAAAGLNPDLPHSRKGALPLVWFGIFAERLDQGAARRTTYPESAGSHRPAWRSTGQTIWLR